jgi:site-specific DNA-methyltransferase (adenine-specific)
MTEAQQVIQWGDCLHIPWTFTRSFHCLITDLPYSKHVHKNATSQSARGGTRKRDLGFESISYKLRRKAAECASLVSRWSLCYSDVESANYLAINMAAQGAEYVRTIPWVRWSMPQLSGDRPPQGFEVIVCAHAANKGKPVKKHWQGPGNLTHLDELCLRGEGKHKTEKPLDQMLRLVSYFTEPGENVLDICAGSGTTGLACKLLGRNFFGCEIDQGWAEHGRDRLVTALTERDAERVKRWLARDDEPVSALAEGPSVARAQARARDKDTVRAMTGLT